MSSVDFVFRIAVYFGLVFTVPVLMYQLLAFIRPISAQTKTRTIMVLSLLSGVLAVFAVLFAYFVTLPAALHFLSTFSSSRIESLFTAKEYLSFVSAYIVSFVVVFELPLVLYGISLMTTITKKQLLSTQRWAILSSFVLAAVITPTPDPLNQLMVAGPMIVSYELAVGAILIRQWWLSKKQKKQHSNNAPQTLSSHHGQARAVTNHYKPVQPITNYQQPLNQATQHQNPQVLRSHIHEMVPRAIVQQQSSVYSRPSKRYADFISSTHSRRQTSSEHRSPLVQAPKGTGQNPAHRTPIHNQSIPRKIKRRELVQ